MKRWARLLIAVGMISCAANVRAQESPPQGHDWLKQLAGEWETESELVVDPSQKPVKAKGTESARSIGGLWTIAESRGSFGGVTMTGITTLGYDRQKKKYIGTFIASMSDYLWQYEGTLDSSGKVLTLNAEGPNPLAPGKLFKFKDVYEVKSKDHKVLTSQILMEDGKWVTFATVNFRRVKQAAK